jgi:hypothetical protein
MSLIDDVIADFRKFIAEHGTEPAYISVSPEVYERLKAEFGQLMEIKDELKFSKFMGLEIRVRE